jgi:geranylgeranyl diphosphate synthase type II
MKSKEYLRIKELVEAHLISFLPAKTDYNQTLLSAMQYSLSAGGKRLRPVLLMASYKLFSTNELEALPFACAVEYIHTYSLIHDDLPGMDNDDLRRGKPTNHKVYGEGMAIIAGDGLLNSSFEIMINDFINTNNYNRIMALKEIASGAGISGMIVGQALDINPGDNLSKEKLNYIHEYKTGALINSSIKAGALIGGAENEDLNLLEIYGKNLGLAFQIKDDLLDIYGDAKTMGKPIGSDAKLNKLTYPNIYGEKESIKILKECHDKAISALETFGNKANLLTDIIKELEFRHQ